MQKAINISKGIDKTNSNVFVSNEFGVKPEDLFKKTRVKQIILAKHLWRYMWFCFLNNPQLMEDLKFGHRTTLLHSLKLVNDLCLYDKIYRQKVQRMEKLYGMKIINRYEPRDYFRITPEGKGKGCS